MLPDAFRLEGNARDFVIMPMKPEKEGMAHFLPSRYRTFWPLRVSRYRVVKELVNYPGVAKFIGAVARSGFVKWYYPILVAAVKAKNVTNNLPLLSVLAFVNCFETSIVFDISGCN